MIKKIISRIFYVALDKHSKKLIIIFFGLKFQFDLPFVRRFFTMYSQIEDINYNLQGLSYAHLRDAINKQSPTPPENCPFLLFHYNHYKKSFDYSSQGINVGDYIQTIATRNAIMRSCPNLDVIYFDRDNLTYYDGPESIVVMQGWFGDVYSFFPNERLFPVFLGFHLSSVGEHYFLNFIKHNPNYFKNKVIGCRDLSTCHIMTSLNINNYLSRCLTLTLPKREKEPENGEVYIVDVPKCYYKYIPGKLLNNARFIEQRSVDKGKPAYEYYHRGNHYIKNATALLSEYRDQAGLIITGALHCASPCTAMGIPVVLIDFGGNMDRLSALTGILPIYSVKDMKSRRIDYQPKSPDIEPLKKLMLKNLDLSIAAVKLGVSQPLEDQELLWEKISSFKAND